MGVVVFAGNSKSKVQVRKKKERKERKEKDGECGGGNKLLDDESN